MIRWPLLAVAAVAPLAGCQWLGVDREGFGTISNRAISVPKVADASPEAIRVNNIGLQLVAGSPFLGLDPTFQVVGPSTATGASEPEIFHRDSTGVFLTDGLVKLCRKDEELAAVLAHELGQMAAESRRTDRMRLRDPIPAAAMGGKPDGSTDMDIARDMYLADFEKSVRKPTERQMYPVTDAKKIARQILSDARFDPKWLDDVQPILKQANRTQVFAKQLGGAAPAPKWNE